MSYSYRLQFCMCWAPLSSLTYLVNWSSFFFGISANICYTYELHLFRYHSAKAFPWKEKGHSLTRAIIQMITPSQTCLGYASLSKLVLNRNKKTTWYSLDPSLLLLWHYRSIFFFFISQSILLLQWLIWTQFFLYKLLYALLFLSYFLLPFFLIF